MNYANDQFFELTGHSRGHGFSWLGLVADEDLPKVEDDWSRMLAGEKSDGVQFRLKKTWINQDGIRSNIWVQSSNYPELDKDGKVISKVFWVSLACSNIDTAKAFSAHYSTFRVSNGPKICRHEGQKKP